MMKYALEYGLIRRQNNMMEVAGRGIWGWDESCPEHIAYGLFDTQEEAWANLEAEWPDGIILESRLGVRLTDGEWAGWCERAYRLQQRNSLGDFEDIPGDDGVLLMRSGALEVESEAEIALNEDPGEIASRIKWWTW